METTKTIYQRLSDFREEVGKIAKDGTNPAFRSKYATLPGILDAIQEPLKKHELVFWQLHEVRDDGKLALTTYVGPFDGKGERLAGTIVMALADAKPQTYVAATTYARRVGLTTVLGLNVDEDDDGNAASGTTTETATKPNF